MDNNIDWEVRLGKFGASDIALILPETIGIKEYKIKPDRYEHKEYETIETEDGVRYLVNLKKNYKLSDTAVNLIAKKNAEIIKGRPLRNIKTQAMLWGERQELYAKKELGKNFKIIDGKTTAHPTIPNLVGTPDCWADDFGVEIKCPFNEVNHLKTLNNNFINSEYLTQIQVYMMIFNKRKWLYVSYDPEMPKDKRLATVDVNWNDGLVEDIEFVMGKINERINSG